MGGAGGTADAMLMEAEELLRGHVAEAAADEAAAARHGAGAADSGPV